MENTGDSYNARSIAENIDRAYKPDNQWFTNYSAAFNSAVAGDAAVADAHHQARNVADTGRPAPGTLNLTHSSMNYVTLMIGTSVLRSG